MNKRSVRKKINKIRKSIPRLQNPMAKTGRRSKYHSKNSPLAGWRGI